VLIIFLTKEFFKCVAQNVRLIFWVIKAEFEGVKKHLICKTMCKWKIIKDASAAKLFFWKKKFSTSQTQDVNFINLLTQSANLLALGILHPTLQENTTKSYSQLLRCTLYASVVQPIRHSPHVVNGHFNVANGFVSKYLIIRLFWNKKNKKLRSFQLILTWKHQNNLKSDGPGCKICKIKMWRMSLFICHNCGELKNTVLVCQ